MCPLTRVCVSDEETIHRRSDSVFACVCFGAELCVLEYVTKLSYMCVWIAERTQKV